MSLSPMQAFSFCSIHFRLLLPPFLIFLGTTSRDTTIILILDPSTHSLSITPSLGPKAT